MSGKYLNAIFSCIESNPEKHWSCDNMLCDWFKKTLTTLSANKMLSAHFRALASGEKARERPKVTAF